LRGTAASSPKIDAPPAEHHPAECVFIYLREARFYSAGTAREFIRRCCVRLEAWQAPPPTLHDAHNKLRTRHTQLTLVARIATLSLFRPRSRFVLHLFAISLHKQRTHAGGGRGRLVARLHFKFTLLLYVECALGRSPLVYVPEIFALICVNIHCERIQRANTKLNYVGLLSHNRVKSNQLCLELLCKYGELISGFTQLLPMDEVLDLSDGENLKISHCKYLMSL
jgi:hypothetical protein